MKQGSWALAAAAMVFCGAVAAQDPVKVAPDVYKAVVDNERTRVLEIHVKPGGKSAMHSHPEHLIIGMTPCKVKFTLPDGKTETVELKTGQTVWSGPVTHSAENVGSNECHVLNVEFKPAAAKAK